jgi:hypothetical protein
MLPDPFDVPAAWYGRDISKKQKLWSYEFNLNEIGELENASKAFYDAGLPLGLITSDNFPLPNLGEVVKRVQKELRDGIGFTLFRGLPVDRYDQKMLATMFCGIGSHIGLARSQNAAGHLLGHVRNIGADLSDPRTRVYQTTARQHFHTDSTDVVGLLCINKAKSGGTSLLASSVTLFNEIVKRRPDLAEELFNPLARDRRGEIPVGQMPFYSVPVYNLLDGYLTCFYHREYIDSAQRYDDAPRVTAFQKEAIDFFDEVVNEPGMYLSMSLEPGDMQFVYNHHLLHDRTEFEDWPEPERRRHLMRLWLCLPEDRPLPDSFAQRYGSVKVGYRGGVVTKETVLHAPIDA